jgi:hypothetical protein
VDWRNIMNEQYLLASGEDRFDQCWHLVQDDDKTKVALRWISLRNELMANDSIF